MLRLNTLLFFLLILSGVSAEEEETLPEVHIAIVGDDNAPKFFETRTRFIDEIVDLLEEEFEVTFSNPSAFMGNDTRESIEEALDRAFEDDEVDIVVALGSFASHLASTRKELPKPTFVFKGQSRRG